MQGLLKSWHWQVPWPLELIANTEAIKKYNQVYDLSLEPSLFRWPFSSFYLSDDDVSSFTLVGNIYLCYSGPLYIHTCVLGDAVFAEGQACKICIR